MTYGVVVFDDAAKKLKQDNKRRVPKAAWVSVAGESAFRIQAVTELPSDVRFWTNLEFADFYGNQFGRHPKLHYSAFLRTEMKSIAEELGVSREHATPDRSAEVLSGVFSRVMQLGERLLGASYAKTGVEQLSDYYALRTQNNHKLPDVLNMALSQAYQPVTKCLHTSDRQGWQNITLRRSRYQHCKDILSMPVPSEYQWRYIDRSFLPQSNAEAIDWIIGSDYPILTNIVIRQKRNDIYAPIIAYQSGSNFERGWMCQSELMWVSQFADVEINGAFICEEGWEMQPELEKFPDLGEFNHASYSLGLVAESLWVSMASPRRAAGGRQTRHYTPRSVWYRAIDRFNMFLAAATLQREDYHVGGYGSGGVWLKYPIGTLDELAGLAESIGLEVPMSKYIERTKGMGGDGILNEPVLHRSNKITDEEIDPKQNLLRKIAVALRRGGDPVNFDWLDKIANTVNSAERNDEMSKLIAKLKTSKIV